MSGVIVELLLAPPFPSRSWEIDADRRGHRLSLPQALETFELVQRAIKFHSVSSRNRPSREPTASAAVLPGNCPDMPII